jgi:chitin synthase
MFSSFFQYLCLAPSFINVLNVYAFCNLHDVRPTILFQMHRLLMCRAQVSWGTKGSDKNEALPSLKSKTMLGADAPTVEDNVNTQQDIDGAFQDTVTRALTKAEEASRPEKPTMDDDNKTFRTRLVAAWALSNAALVISIENIDGWLNVQDKGITSAYIQQWSSQMSLKRNNYFAALLYGTFALAFIRFLGVSFGLSFMV